MNMILMDKYFLRTDANNYILSKVQKGKKAEILYDENGNTSYENFGSDTYHSSLEQVLKKIRETEIMTTPGIEDLHDLKKLLDKINLNIDEVRKILSGEKQ